MYVLACQKCGAGLPPPDPQNVRVVSCNYCRTMVRAVPPDPSETTDGLASSEGEEAARIAMTDEAVLGLLRQHFTGEESTYLCPSISGKRELGARCVHARHLPNDERVLLLYDDTVFGSGDEGFLVTTQRLCWKNGKGRAHMIEWAQIDPDRMYADKRKLMLGVHAIEITGDESIVEACERAFHVLAFSARAPAGCARSGIALTQSADSSASLPTAAAATASAGSTPSGRPMTVPMAQRPSAHPTQRPSQRPSHPATLESAIAPIFKAAPRPAVSNATPPPPSAVSYDSYVVHASSQKGPSFVCWCCNTPLYWNTPQCARCNAWPTAQGWRRTA